MKETKKIAIACFIGAVICTGVAFIFSPYLWWLGMLAGFGAGYLAYDLQEVRAAIPIAWKATRRKTGRGLFQTLNWLKKPHPFFCLNLTIGLPLSFLALKYIVLPGFWEEEDLLVVNIAKVVFIGAFVSLGSAFYAPGVGIVSLARLGGSSHRFGEKSFWQPSDWFGAKERRRFREKHYREIPVTYWNIYRLILRGLGIVLFECLCFPFWTLWKFLGKFLWTLFKLIHSHKRVLCGVDGVIGGTAAYLLHAFQILPPGGWLVAIIFGGVIGAALGVLDYEVVSRRLLKLAPVPNSTQ